MLLIDIRDHDSEFIFRLREVLQPLQDQLSSLNGLQLSNLLLVDVGGLLMTLFIPTAVEVLHVQPKCIMHRCLTLPSLRKYTLDMNE